MLTRESLKAMPADLTDPIYQRTPVPFIVIVFVFKYLRFLFVVRLYKNVFLHLEHIHHGLLMSLLSAFMWYFLYPIFAKNFWALLLPQKYVYSCKCICGDWYLCICQYRDHSLLIPVLSGFMWYLPPPNFPKEFLRRVFFPPNLIIKTICYFLLFSFSPEFSAHISTWEQFEGWQENAEK